MTSPHAREVGACRAAWNVGLGVCEACGPTGWPQDLCRELMRPTLVRGSTAEASQSKDVKRRTDTVLDHGLHRRYPGDKCTGVATPSAESANSGMFRRGGCLWVLIGVVVAGKVAVGRLPLWVLFSWNMSDDAKRPFF